MNQKFYLAAYGNEGDIRALADGLNFPGSHVKALKAKLASGQYNQGKQWMWRSPYKECLGEFPEDELEAFLSDNPDLRKKLNAHRGKLDDLAAIIVCELDEGESPNGYSISSDLVKLLGDMNASLEIDIVPKVPADGVNK